MKIVVSACLAGDNCKYNGGNNFSEKIANLSKDNEIIKICPEVLANAGIPRVHVEIKNGILINKNGVNVHKQYMIGVTKAVETLSIW